MTTKHPGPESNPFGFAKTSRAFLSYLDGFMDALVHRDRDTLIAEAGGPASVAAIAVDLVGGFCHAGPLASDRVAALIASVGSAFSHAYARGVRHFAILRDAHDPGTAEFDTFPPHCLASSDESQLVPELSGQLWVNAALDVPKNSLGAWVDDGPFRPWVTDIVARGVTTIVVAGDCTDLCVFHTAMGIRLWASVTNRNVRIIVPANLVDTYDLPVDLAATIGAMPHDGNLLHATFLYHLRLNGIEVIRVRYRAGMRRVRHPAGRIAPATRWRSGHTSTQETGGVEEGDSRQ